MKYLAELLYLAGLLTVITGVALACGIVLAVIVLGVALVTTGLLIDHSRKG